MKIQNGTAYENNFARAAAYYLGTCAPAPSGGAPLAAYKLVTGIYSAIAADAAALGFHPVPDVSFAPWEPQKGREKDIKSIRGAIAKIEELMTGLFEMAASMELREGEALLPAGSKLSRPLKRILLAAGVTADLRNDGIRLVFPAGSAQGLKELAAISRTNTRHMAQGQTQNKPDLYFSRCVFEPGENWIALAFDRLLGADGRLVWLCGELEKRAYRRIDCYEGNKISLDYVKQHGKKEEPLKLAWAE